MLKLIYGHRFEKDLKLAKRRGYNVEKVAAIITLLLEEKALPPKMLNHRLIGVRFFSRVFLVKLEFN